jgi:hypothetical protein
MYAAFLKLQHIHNLKVECFFRLPVLHQFCRVWIHQIRYYGATTTSPLEGLHGGIKRWLHTPKNGFGFRTTKLATDTQYQRIRGILGQCVRSSPRVHYTNYSSKSRESNASNYYSLRNLLNKFCITSRLQGFCGSPNGCRLSVIS